MTFSDSFQGTTGVGRFHFVSDNFHRNCISAMASLHLIPSTCGSGLGVYSSSFLLPIEVNVSDKQRYSFSCLCHISVYMYEYSSYVSVPVNLLECPLVVGWHVQSPRIDSTWLTL